MQTSFLPVEMQEGGFYLLKYVFGVFMYPAQAGRNSAGTGPFASKKPDAESNSGNGCDESNDGRNYRQNGFIENRAQNQTDGQCEQHREEADQAVNVELTALFTAAASGTGIGCSLLMAAS